MRLRPYEAADEGALVDVWFDSWRSVGLSHPVATKADLAARVPTEVAGRWTVTIAEHDGRVVGFLAVAHEENRLDQLFVHPDVQGSGVGAALFRAATAQLREGFWLSTQPGNRRARGFYERRGMVLDRLEGDSGSERAIYVMRSGG
ncbi:MAG: GNAT family N-acetyltransferase [Phenylobacterium sp.]|nr:GNAT family N-acetyltransferase [Phenylobacterium sp.]MCA6358169.1 GNAT family N-acetyltransferase [Phenylobacterium sp.]